MNVRGIKLGFFRGCKVALHFLRPVNHRSMPQGELSTHTTIVEVSMCFVATTNTSSLPFPAGRTCPPAHTNYQTTKQGHIHLSN
jgi:hypothetical protein